MREGWCACRAGTAAAGLFPPPWARRRWQRRYRCLRRAQPGPASAGTRPNPAVAVVVRSGFRAGGRHPRGPRRRGARTRCTGTPPRWPRLAGRPTGRAPHRSRAVSRISAGTPLVSRVVRMYPGATALTFTLLGPSSTAAARVNPRAPPCWRHSWRPRTRRGCRPVELTFTIFPSRWRAEHRRHGAGCSGRHRSGWCRAPGATGGGSRRQERRSRAMPALFTRKWMVRPSSR